MILKKDIKPSLPSYKAAIIVYEINNLFKGIVVSCIIYKIQSLMQEKRITDMIDILTNRSILTGAVDN